MAVRPASDNVVRWLLADHLGSTARAVRAGGTVDGEQRYMPYGLDRYGSGSLNTAYRVTGQRIEDNTDLYFYGGRWYDPAVGRFVQPDSIVPEPANPGSLNRYTYVLNNPLRYTDPTGHFPWPLFYGYAYGALYEYGSQVKGNLESGMGLGPALTTNIDPVKVMQSANVGEAAWLSASGVVFGGTYGVMAAAPAVMGAGTGAAAIRAAQEISRDGDPTNEVRNAIKPLFTVLGKDPNYRELAKRVGGNFLHIVDDVWNKMTPAERWFENQRFLDEAIANKHAFLLSDDFFLWINRPADNFFTRELHYLLEKGYRLLIIDGRQWLVKGAEQILLD